MRIVPMILLLLQVLGATAYVKDAHQQATNETGATQKVFDRALKALYLRGADLDHTTLAKPVHTTLGKTIPNQGHMTMFGKLSAGPSHPAISPWPMSGRTLRTHWVPQPLHADNPFNPKNLPVDQMVERSGAEPGPIKDWPIIYRSLVAKGLQPVTGEEAMQMVKDAGAIIADLRLASEFKERTMPGAVSVPMFEPTPPKGWQKRLLSAMLGVPSRDRNPNFNEMATEKLPLDRPVIVACNRGGKLDMNRTNSYGKAKIYTDTDQYTVSLKAAWELYQLGFTKLCFITGGFSAWVTQGLPTIPGGDA